MMVVRRVVRSLASALVLASAGALPAASADLAAPVAADTAASSWTFKFTPYGWLAFLTGQSTVKGRTFDVQVNPAQLLQNLDWSTLPIWMSYAEARYGKLTLFNDIVWAALAGSGSFAKSRQGVIGSQTLVGAVQADYTQAVVEFGAAYEVWSNGTSGAPGTTAIDVLAGARYWHQSISLSADVNLNVVGNLPVSAGRVIAKSGAVDWVDPIVGGRIRYQLGSGRTFTLRGDVGGFGAGSDISWQAIGTLEWPMLQVGGRPVDAYLGYRALYVDYTKGSGTTRYEYNVLQHGPVIGATMRF